MYQKKIKDVVELPPTYRWKFVKDYSSYELRLQRRTLVFFWRTVKDKRWYSAPADEAIKIVSRNLWDSQVWEDQNLGVLRSK